MPAARKKTNRPLSALGEFGLIECIRKIAGSKNVVLGIGDDCAVVAHSQREYGLITTDMLLEDVHFKRTMPPAVIGHKALACSISDIAAMGGIPEYAVVSLGVPRALTEDYVIKIYQGMKRLADKFRVKIVGGDTVKSGKIIINVALWGRVEKNKLVTRNGARKGDAIFVTGPLGRSYSTGHHARFTPRVKEARWLVQHCKPNSMIDISDGLSSDLGHILEESKVGAEVYEKNIPRRNKATLNEALNDGEDFELLFTVSSAKAKLLASKKPFRFYKIGKITRKGLRLIKSNGKSLTLTAKGYKHF